MFWIAAALFATPAHAEDLTIHVAADIERVVLQCGSEVYEKRPSEGTRTDDGRVAVTFPIRPGRDCKVFLLQPAGSVEQVGTWGCTASGCTNEGVDEASLITPGPGELYLLLGVDFPHTQLELSCDSGYRERITVNSHRGVFAGVPDDACTVNFKGGPPMKFKPLTPGVWQCHIVASTPVCKKQ